VTVRIVHIAGQRAGAAMSFAKDVVRFGRAPDNDVVFDAERDREASGHHAELRREGGAWVVVDLGSRNGTFVSGRRVEREAVRSGDELSFGAKGPRVRVEMEPAKIDVTAPAMPLAVAPAASYAAAPPPPPPPPPPPVAPQAAPPAGARVGQRTIAMMIQSAVAAAGARARPRRTVEINALVEQQVSAATASQRRTAYALGALLVLALGLLGGLIFWSTRSEDDIQKLRGELASLSPDDPRRKEIEGRLGTLHPSNASFGRNLYDRSRKGIFMLAAGGEGFCTAFAVRQNILATNAHCIVQAKKHGGSVVALENEGRGAVRFSVTDMRTHPSYRDDDPNAITPDVGVVTISGRAAVVLDVAARDELSTAGAGDEVYLIGFPGRLMDASNPAATFLAAHVGRMTNAAGRPGAYAEAWLVQHDAGTTHGTSGSPIFNGRGKVIAINAGGYLEGDEEKIAGRQTEVVKASPYKFGMRIDLLDLLLPR
jgi:V8-like Glu-specific endopeptidase